MSDHRRKVTTSIHLPYELYEQLALLAEKRRATRGGKRSVSCVVRDLCTTPQTVAGLLAKGSNA